MSLEIVDPDKDDVESLIQIYSSPDLYHRREEASWFVRSFFDYHVKIVKHEGNVVGAVFWNVVEEKHHGLAEIGDLWIDKNFRRRGLRERLLQVVIEDMKRTFAGDNYVLRRVLVTTSENMNQRRSCTRRLAFESLPFSETCFHEGRMNLCMF
jgi:GNAT superfamily N-acetyltransferase